MFATMTLDRSTALRMVIDAAQRVADDRSSYKAAELSAETTVWQLGDSLTISEVLVELETSLGVQIALSEGAFDKGGDVTLADLADLVCAQHERTDATQ